MTERASARYRRPVWFAVRVLNPLVRWLGAASTLHVPGRISGRRRRVPLNVVDLDGGRYLVSVRGQTEWVRNLRTAGHCTLSRRGRRDRYRVVEVSGEQRARVVAAYRDRWGNGQVARLLDQLPADGHPVFRLHPAQDGQNSTSLS
jgi:deazaflavin-dependent oxidoreductase (nitroreductase family)